ncbi:hypothetical protein K435DRAFT_765067 [Dendrothele bispora CBS 962.96]|uniref:Uncharacterized protein n=1 Tax=Dendrothele bispora (strain CBS 962.96) TaxID=1314807 RepID=A0A4V4HCV5_DENBC|nr:hypothetical protein K435DRAFT_765067 [Dendrothele bispora CBS 962.96]
MAPIPQDILPQHPRFQLNSSGLAGFFGGDEAIAAMNTAQYYKGRKFMGFYNSPGGFRMAKHYGRLAKSRIWRGFYPDVYLEPHEVFSLDGGPGKMCPDFLGARTGVVMDRTGHLGYLFLKKMRHRASSKCELVKSSRKATKPVKVTIVDLGDIELPANYIHRPAPLRRRVLLVNAFTVLASLAASIISGLSKDWYAFYLILLGIIAHGAACFILGSGSIEVRLVPPPKKSPRGDGLMTMEGDIMIVLGKEKEVFQITRGSISVEFPAWVKWNGYFAVGACCLLLMLQLLVQLFLIPQATLFGQILFLCSFGVSFLCNTYLSALDKEDLQRETLGDKVWNVGKNSVKGYTFQNWTTMAIAMLYVLRPTKDGVAEQLFNRLLPNQTPEWKTFKKDIFEVYDSDEAIEPIARAEPSDEPSDEQRVVVQNMYMDWQDAVNFLHGYKKKDASQLDDNTLKSGGDQQVLEKLECA